MTLSSKLEYERNQYYKLQEKLEIIESYINNCIENLDEASISLDKFFIIDNDSIDNFYFKNKNADLKELINVINETIKPNIKQKINYLSEELLKIEKNNMIKE